MEVTSHFQGKYSFDVYLVIAIIVGDLHQIKPDVELSALLWLCLNRWKALLRNSMELNQET
ncbi:hypothetical protein, partial [Vibrio cholerae]|uniref:hypothetical protein n=1 Tax=Vibrio cholerae TaxID=666 RepID=UPI00227036D5